MVFADCRAQVDLAFVLDLSGSTDMEYQRLLTISHRLVNNLDMRYDRARVAAVTYGDTAQLAFPLDKYNSKQEVLNALRFMPNQGRTNTQEAVRIMRRDVFSSRRGDRAGVDNVCVIITDGGSNVQHHNTGREAESAKEDNVAIYVVALGDRVDMVEVNNLAGKANEPLAGYVYRVRSDRDIDDVVEGITESICE